MKNDKEDEMSEESILTIRVFGSFLLVVAEKGEERIVRTRTPKDLQFLAYLVYHYDQPQERDALALQFWEKDRRGQLIGETDRLNLLARTLSELGSGLGERARACLLKLPLRQILFATEFATETGTESVAKREETELTVDLDLKRWRVALASGEAHGLLEVAPCYLRGEFLQGWSEEWIVKARQQMRKDYLAALERATKHAVDRDDQETAQRCLTLAMEIDPWNQALWRSLMERLAAERRYARLFRFYADLQARSARHDVELEDETRKLFVGLRDAALKFTASEANGLLPAPVSSFVAREREVAEIAALVRPGRLVTLVGMGGIGKSRLALAVGRELNEEFYDRAWFLDLAPIIDPAQVVNVVATTLGIRERPGEPLSQTLQAVLRPQKRLLILDNCEHLLSAAALFCDSLLRLCPHIALLATSREPLYIGGESVWHVPALAFPDVDADAGFDFEPAWITDFGAVRLFVERASTPQQPFHLDADTAPAVAHICHYLGGIPLAIELAAARVTRTKDSVHQIASSLGHSLEILTLGGRIDPTRHQTLRAVIDWSYNLLDTKERSKEQSEEGTEERSDGRPETRSDEKSKERTVFRRLGIFRGGFTEEAANAICFTPADREAVENSGDTPAHVLLETLVAKSLLTSQPTGEGIRYRLLEPLREFALEKLESEPNSDEVRALYQRHHEYFLRFAEQTIAEARQKGADQVVCLNRLAVDHENLRFAIDGLRDTGRIEAALRLAGTMWRFWYVRGHHMEGYERLSGLLTLARELQTPIDNDVRILALNGAGNIAFVRADYPAARRLYEESLTFKQQVGDLTGLATGYASIANTLSAEGDYAEAQRLLEQSLESFRQLVDQHNIALTLTNIGTIAHELKEYPRARVCHEESLALFRALRNREHISLVLNNLVSTLLYMQDYVAAKPLLRECLTLCYEIQARHRFVNSLLNALYFARLQNDHLSAARLYGAQEARADQWEVSRPTHVMSYLEGQIAASRTELGADVFNQQMQLGRTLTLEEILALVANSGC